MMRFFFYFRQDKWLCIICKTRKFKNVQINNKNLGQKKNVSFDYDYNIHCIIHGFCRENTGETYGFGQNSKLLSGTTIKTIIKISFLQ